MELLEQLYTLMESRAQTYDAFTADIWERLPHVKKGIDEFLRLSNPDLYTGSSWVLTDIGVFQNLSPEFGDENVINFKIVAKYSWISKTGQKIVSGDILPNYQP